MTELFQTFMTRSCHVVFKKKVYLKDGILRLIFSFRTIIFNLDWFILMYRYTLSNNYYKISDLFVFVVPTVPIVKDQSRVAGSANLPSGNTAVSTASMITGENTHSWHEVIHTALESRYNISEHHSYTPQNVCWWKTKANIPFKRQKVHHAAGLYPV